MTQRIALVASHGPEAQAELAKLKERYGDVAPEEADVIVALGGDGFMLRTLHRHLSLGKPVYGMKLGTVGFLLNPFHADDLPARIARAQPTVMRPLAKARTAATWPGRYPKLTTSWPY